MTGVEVVWDVPAVAAFVVCSGLVLAMVHLLRWASRQPPAPVDPRDGTER